MMVALTFISYLTALFVLPSFIQADHLSLNRRIHQHKRALPAGWSAKGCHTDDVKSRTLLGIFSVNPTGNSVESCVKLCDDKKFHFAGLEYGQECYCGNRLANGTPAPDPDCSTPCPNSAEKCGGPDRLSLFEKNGDLPPPPAPGSWESIGCWRDSITDRSLSEKKVVAGDMTVEKCTNICAGYSFSGVEYSEECHCGNSINNPLQAPDEECSMPCSGDGDEQCGGPNRLNVYHFTSTGSTSPASVQTTNLPANWAYQFCLAEPNNGGRVFQYQIKWGNNNNVNACLSQCEKFGYPAAGLQYAEECWCGDLGDVGAHGGTQAPEGECNMACSGDPAHICGGPFRNTYYKRDNPFVWHTPSNTGRYEFFAPGLVVPLLVTVGINNKIVFLEKFGSGNKNSTGAYELDPFLVKPDWRKAWREMHVRTDVFCSAALVLPDKAARHLNIAGWTESDLSEYGVRLYTPTGSAGQASTSDWEEDVNTVKLQRPRWYPSALVMGNGSILVMGGQVYNGGPPQDNLEILPRPRGGDTVVKLDWLGRTNPNNLYPFLFVLPTGILVVHFNEARILDKTTFNTVRVLPKIPGAVNNDGGRTYPFAGTAMLLPQKAPYDEPIEVLICGGGTPATMKGLDNCVTITPEVPGATWNIERMPSSRVLLTMANLVDGSLLIADGAEKGAGGFANATKPNFGAVLYDPSQPTNQRFSKLDSTNIARMYHSESTLLPDGSVLISGSDPLDPNFPEEYRLERYIPPYLASGLPRPTFTLEKTDVTYGESFQITLTSGSTENLRVSLIAASSNTHGNTMGTRTIFPAVTCDGNTCTIIAPPNAGVCPPGWFMLFVLDGPTPSESQWVRIGGDPAKLGNWPPGPVFTKPGV